MSLRCYECLNTDDDCAKVDSVHFGEPVECKERAVSCKNITSADGSTRRGCLSLNPREEFGPSVKLKARMVTIKF